MTMPRGGVAAVKDGSHLYAIGGASSSQAETTVERTTFNADGTLQPWSVISTMLYAHQRPGAIVAGRCLYVVGGSLPAYVESTTIHADGSLGSWAGLGTLPTSITDGQDPNVVTVQAQGYLIALAANYTPLVVEAKIDTTNCTLGPWVTLPPFQTVRHGLEAIASGDFIYAIGGHDASVQPLATVDRAEVNPDGTLGPWTSMNVMNEPRPHAAAALSGETIYVVGGGVNAYMTNTVEHAQIQPDGSLSAWTLTSPLEGDRTELAAVAHNGNIYALGGWTATYGTNPTADVEVAPRLFSSGGPPTVTPTVSPSLTPTSTSTQTGLRPGGIFITGHDPDYHAAFSEDNALGAQHIIQDAVAYVTANKASPRLLLITDLRNPGGENSDSRLGLNAAGFSGYAVADYGSGTSGILDLHTVDFTAYDVVVVASDYGGWLRQDELDVLNARAADLAAYVNGGGGIVAFNECGCRPTGPGINTGTTRGRFGFVPFAAGTTAKLQPEEGFTLTATGLAMGLTTDDVNGNYSHSIFTANGGLSPVDLDPDGEPVSLATSPQPGTASSLGPIDVLGGSAARRGSTALTRPFAVVCSGASARRGQGPSGLLALLARFLA
jgi:hypothetical protein